MPTISQAGDEWLAHMEATGLSGPRLRALRYTVQQLIDANQDIQMRSIQPKHIDRWRTGHSWSPSTYNRKLGEMRQFLAWCRQRGYLPASDSLMYGWRPMKRVGRHRLRIPQDQWDRLLDAAIHPRDRALVACGLYLMARVSELRSIRVRDLDLAEGEVKITRHKTRRVDTMPICMELDGELRRWLVWYQANATVGPASFLLPARLAVGFLYRGTLGHAAPLNESWPVVPSRPITDPSHDVQRVLKAAGYDTSWEGGHTLRRSAARAYYDELAAHGHDGALRQVQTMLDHTNSQITEAYLGTDRDKAERSRSLRGKMMFAPKPAANVINLEAHRG